MPRLSSADRRRIRFGEWLGLLREEAGATCENLAIESGLHKSAVSRIENAQRGTSRETVTRLADALGLDDVTRCAFFMAAGYFDLELVVANPSQCTEVAREALAILRRIL